MPNSRCYVWPIIVGINIRAIILSQLSGEMYGKMRPDIDAIIKQVMPP